MRLATIDTADGPRAAVVTPEGLHLVDGGDAPTPTVRQLLGTGLDGLPATAGPLLDAAHVAWLPPVPDPAHVFCIGLNYETHRQEGGRPDTAHPTVFLRTASSQIGHLQPLVMPKQTTQFDYEGELAIVIGTGGRHIKEDQALRHVFGVACYNDASVRDWQNHTTQWTPGKNFAGTGAFGPEIVTLDEVPALLQAALTTRVNGVELQRATIGEMTFPIPALIAYISTFCELVPGDLIVTGTPGGVGMRRQPPTYLRAGDVVEIEVTGVGVLRNVVVAEEADDGERDSQMAFIGRDAR